EDRQVDRALLEHVEPALGALGLLHGIALALEDHPERPADVLLVVDDEDRGAHRAPPTKRACTARTASSIRAAPSTIPSRSGEVVTPRASMPSCARAAIASSTARAPSCGAMTESAPRPSSTSTGPSASRAFAQP